MQRKSAYTLMLTPTEEVREVLAELVRCKLTSVRLALRARIVLLAAMGLHDKEVAQMLDVGRIQVSRWRHRYLDSGLEGIERDLPRGAPPLKVTNQFQYYLKLVCHIKIMSQ